MISAAEGWRWLQQTLAAAPSESRYRLRALLSAGMLSAYIPAYAEGAGLLREVAEGARATGDRNAEAWAELWLGRIAFFGGDPETAQARLERAASGHEQLGNTIGLVRALSLLGLLQALLLGRGTEGEERLERAAALAHAGGDSFGEGYAHMMLGLCAAEREDLDLAASHSRLALGASALGPLLGIPLQVMGRVAQERDPSRALRLLGAASIHLQRTGTVAPPFLQARSDATRSSVEQLVGADAALRLWSEGRRLSLAEAISEAIGDDSRSLPKGQGVLTPREEQVAALVARGRTNREVAAALHISLRTAESHLDHILSKLGLRNRTELAARSKANTADSGDDPDGP
jgi:non-specific serine/threonine protein kinase